MLNRYTYFRTKGSGGFRSILSDQPQPTLYFLDALLHNPHDTSSPQYIIPAIHHPHHTSPPRYITPTIHHPHHTSSSPYITSTIHHRHNTSSPPYITPTIHHPRHTSYIHVYSQNRWCDIVANNYMNTIIKLINRYSQRTKLSGGVERTWCKYILSHYSDLTNSLYITH